MEPTSGRPRSMSFDAEVLGQPQAWVVQHRGLEYPGEVIDADSVDPDWGRPLEMGLCFRVVFFMVARRIPRGRIQDRRVAMAVPRRCPFQTSPTLGSEIRAIHEARSRYVRARDPDAEALRRVMEEREA